MKDRKQTQVIQWKEGKVPVSIKLGRVFLTIGAILFLISSVFSLGSWITRFVGHWVDFGPELKKFFPELLYKFVNMFNYNDLESYDEMIQQ